MMSGILILFYGSTELITISVRTWTYFPKITLRTYLPKEKLNMNTMIYA